MTHSELKAMTLDEIKDFALEFFGVDLLKAREQFLGIPADADDSHEFLQETIAAHLELED